MRICVLSILLAFFSDRALAIPVGGRLFTDQYFYTENGTLAQSSISAWLDYDTKIDSHWGVRAIGEFDLFAKNREHPDEVSTFVQLREGYVSYLSEGIDLRIGEQIIPWGKSDGVNPTDYFTAKKYIFLNPDDEVRRVGAPATNFGFTPLAGNSPLTFQLVVEPSYAQSKLLIPSQLIPEGLTVNQNPPNPTPFSKQALEYGGRISFQKSNYDFSLSAFKGFAALPEFIFNSSTSAVDSVNAPERAFGGDASFTFGNYIIRFESAVHLPDNGSISDPLFGYVEPDHWDTVLGIETPILNDFRLQLQFLYRYHLYYQNKLNPNFGNPQLNAIMSRIATANSTLLNYQQQGNPGATFRLAYSKDNFDWSPEIFFVGYFGNGQDYLIRPQVGYVPHENWKITAGVDYYGGEASRPLGALHSLSDAFLEVKTVF